MSLTTFTGCQASGKTFEMIKCATTVLDIIGEDGKGLMIKSDKDNRDMINKISSNSSSYKGLSSKFEIVSVRHLMGIISDYELDKYDVICIDEGQLFDDLHDFCEHCLDLNYNIYVSGLDSDWRGNDFGEIHKILRLSTSFIKMQNAKCKLCFDSIRREHGDIRTVPIACRTAKISGDFSVVEQIGGEEFYIPVCLKHHKESLKRIEDFERNKHEKVSLLNIVKDS